MHVNEFKVENVLNAYQKVVKKEKEQKQQEEKLKEK